jgi:hypothetical protein
MPCYVIVAKHVQSETNNAYIALDFVRPHGIAKWNNTKKRPRHRVHSASVGPDSAPLFTDVRQKSNRAGRVSSSIAPCQKQPLVLCSQPQQI